MSVEISHYSRPPIPAHLVYVRRLGLSLAGWATRAAERRATQLERERERVRVAWENRCQLAQLERQRDRVWSQWQLHHLR